MEDDITHGARVQVPHQVCSDAPHFHLGNSAHLSVNRNSQQRVKNRRIRAHQDSSLRVSKGKKKKNGLQPDRLQATSDAKRGQRGRVTGATLTGPHVHSSEGFFQPRRKLATSLRSRPNNAVLFPLNRADEEPGPTGIREDISRSAEITRHRSLRPRL